MEARLLETAERLGVGPEDRAWLASVFATAMRPRSALDDHDPDYLHPARTALILMDDAGVAIPRILATAFLTETRASELRADPRHLHRGETPVGSLLEQVPGATAPLSSDPSRVLEDLVTAGPEALLVALAERLDHARHLHLRDPEEWPAYHAMTCAAHAPAAARAHPRLEQRLAWWCRTFRTRFLAGG